MEVEHLKNLNKMSMSISKYKCQTHGKSQETCNIMTRLAYFSYPKKNNIMEILNLLFTSEKLNVVHFRLLVTFYHVRVNY